MKRFRLKNLIFVSLFFCFAFSSSWAQFPNQPQEVANRPPRPNLLEELNLSSDQIQRIRRLNKERRPVMMEAQRRLHEANRALDEAIYAEHENEAEIQARIKDVQLAHAEVIKNRLIIEREVRRVLTPEQLAKFRSLRAQFMLENNPGSRPPNRGDRLRNLRRGIVPKPPGNRPPRQP